MSEDDEFCRKCGFKLEKEEEKLVQNSTLQATREFISRKEDIQERAPQKKSRIWLVLTLILIFTGMLFPTPHTLTKQEAYTTYTSVQQWDMYQTCSCSRTLEDGYYIHWDLSNYPNILKINIAVQSTEDLVITSKTSQGLIYEKKAKIYDHSLYCNGPSLYVGVKNYDEFWTSKSAVISGSINIDYYHSISKPITKYRTNHYKQWLPWWIP